ncbi:MAG: hypothetical protein ABIH46_06265 [Chloroflexota bacterium]
MQEYEMDQWHKRIAQWWTGDTLYLSVPFTWLIGEADTIANYWREHNKTVLIGGPGLMEPNDCLHFQPILFHNPCATFTTRGCPNACPFCGVPKLEGDLREIPDFRPAPTICDNNLLAASRNHIRRVIDSLKVFSYVDFNQGLDARLFDSEIAGWLGELRCKVRFAFDHWNMEGMVKDAIALCRKYSSRKIGVYVLVGFDDSPSEAVAKLEKVRSWGIRPTPMRFQPLDAKVKNGYAGPGWTELELRRVTRYYSRLRFLEHIPFEEYEYGGSFDQLALETIQHST